MFRHETKDESKFGIGVLFQDGTFKKLRFSKDEQTGLDSIVKIPFKAQISGNIINVAQDLEHSRIIYILSEGEDPFNLTEVKNAQLWCFTKGELYNLTENVKVTQKSRLIPFFSPAENSQIVILYPLENCIRILEHRMEKDENTGNDLLRP